MATIIFIYSKEGKVKALNGSDAIERHFDLAEEGWKHTATIDACVWIENLHNDVAEGELAEEIKSLGNKMVSQL